MCAMSLITFACACVHTIPYSCQMWALVFDARRCTHTQDYSHARTRTLSTHACMHLFSHSFSLYCMCHITKHIRLCLRMYNPIITSNNPYLIHSCLYAPIFALILVVPRASSHLRYTQHKAMPTDT